MSTPLHAVLTGSFTSDGAIRNISLPSGYDKFEMVNITDMGSTAANNNVMLATGTSLMPAGYGIYTPKTSGAATLDPSVTVTTGGFTFVSNSATTANGGSVALSGTEVSQASPAVCGTGSTANLVSGSSVVRVFGTTGMLQIAGMDFTVGTVVANTSFQLKYLDSSGFAAAATAGSYRIINSRSMYYPKSRYITGITKASSAVITMSVAHDYTVGQLVRLVVPDEFGMSEMDGLLGTITAISTGSTNTITVNIDSTSFTTFAFPTSATAGAGVTFAQVVPVGEAATSPYQNLLDDATDNQSFTGIQIGGTVQTTGKVYQWSAVKGVSV
jgi:hypothetical protein